jgi:prepilin-type N-terminal cleavage/methylation domain-containing protein
MKPSFSQYARVGFRPRVGRQLRGRIGLTLVELLVTISIIAILATIFLGALQVATQEAKEMKTKSMIVKLNNLIMPRYEAYRTRRVPLPLSLSVTGAGAVSISSVAQKRLDCLHEIMRLEMPDRWSDVYDAANPSMAYAGFYNPITTLTGIPLPALNQAYYNAYIAPALRTPPGSPPSLTYQNAETLYLIVSLGFVDELGGRDLFNESNIGDADQDGFPEFVDAWGTPIRFLRWAPGFTDSELNGAGGLITATSGNILTVAGSVTRGSSYGLSPHSNAYNGKQITVWNPNRLNPSGVASPGPSSATIVSSTYDPTTGHTTIVLQNPITPDTGGGVYFGIDPDPFDPAMAYPNVGQESNGLPVVPFAIYPLIYSAGPNKTFGISSDFGSAINYGLPAYNNFPFLIDSNNLSLGAESDSMGSATSEQYTVSGWEPSGWLDNIHNHMIGTK